MTFFNEINKFFVRIFRCITYLFEEFENKSKLSLVVLSVFILFSATVSLFSVQYSMDTLGEFPNTAIFAGEETDCNYISHYRMIGLFPHILRVPIYWIFGWSIYTLRISAAIFAIATMLLAYFTIENFSNRKIAFLSTAIYSLLPFWTYYNKWGLAFSLFSILIFYSLSLWYKKKDKKYLYLSTFFCALSIVRHILFVYVFLAVLFIRYFIFKAKLTKKDILFFILGMSPYIVAVFSFTNLIF